MIVGGNVFSVEEKYLRQGKSFYFFLTKEINTILILPTVLFGITVLKFGITETLHAQIIMNSDNIIQ